MLTKSIIEDNQELQQRLHDALKHADEKEKHAAQIQKALDIANQRRIQAKESLSQLLAAPLVDLAPAPKPNEEIESLKSQLRICQTQLTSVLERYIQRE